MIISLYDRIPCYLLQMVVLCTFLANEITSTEYVPYLYSGTLHYGHVYTTFFISFRLIPKTLMTSSTAMFATFIIRFLQSLFATLMFYMYFVSAVLDFPLYQIWFI